MPPGRVPSLAECEPTESRRRGHPPSGKAARGVTLWPNRPRPSHDYRLHRLCCPHSKTLTCGMLPAGVSRTAFGPRLYAVLSLLSGADRPSKRQVAQLDSDLLGPTTSLGMIATLVRLTAEVLEQPAGGARRRTTSPLPRG